MGGVYNLPDGESYLCYRELVNVIYGFIREDGIILNIYEEFVTGLPDILFFLMS